MRENFEPLYFSRQIAEIEKQANAPLMQRAGLAVAARAREMAAGKSVLVLAGPGNNGQDALIAASHLKSWWFDVEVVRMGGDIPKRKWDLVIDGLFGTGLNRKLDAESVRLVNQVNSLQAPILAIDIPSGIKADTGEILGGAIRATCTLTFIALKPGLLTLEGPDHCGKILLDKLGLSPDLEPSGWALDRGILDNLLQPRPKNSHKGMFGSVGIIGGQQGMAGAAILASRACLKMGAGKVHLDLLDPLPVDFAMPEIMMTGVFDLTGGQLDCLVAGPGLGKSARARELLKHALGCPLPLVLDADALNLVADEEELKEDVLLRSEATILTPHPAEAARLLGSSVTQVQSDRISAALRLAAHFSCSVVLKGCGSVCAFADGHYCINTSGNPGLSQAGMGDVLSGMVAAILAQKCDQEEAVAAAVYLHGAAADSLVAKGIGPLGLSASEVIEEARRLLNQGCSPMAPKVTSDLA